MERDLCTSSGPTFCSKQGWSAEFSSLQEFCGTDLKCWPEGSGHLICLAKLVLIQPRMQWSATATRASADSCSASPWAPTLYFCRTATQPVSPHPELLHEVICSQVQDWICFFLNIVRFMFFCPWANWGPSERQPCPPAYWVLPSVWQTASPANFIFLCIM